MEVLKDISQLTKGCGVTFIKNDDFHFYEYLMVHPNRETYYLFIDNWTQEVVRIHIMRTREYGITSCSSYNEGAIYFKNKEDAQAVIDNSNFRSILDAIYKD